MSRPESGVLVPLADVTLAFVGLKIRTVGFLTSYQAHTGKGQLASGHAELCVDLNLALKGTTFGELPLQSKLMIIGSLEKEETGQTLILEAICVLPVEYLDIRLWEQAARELSQVLHNESGIRAGY